MASEVRASETDLRLADAIVAALGGAVGRPPDEVQVHFRDETAVVFLECGSLPADDPDRVDGILVVTGTAVERALGRRFDSDGGRVRVSERGMVFVLRLADPSAPDDGGLTGAPPPPAR